MRVIVYLTLFLSALFSGLYWVYTQAKKITYTYKIDGIEGVSVQSMMSGIVNLKIAVTVFIVNPTKLSLLVNYLYYEVFYKGNLIAKSSRDRVNTEIIKIKSNTTIPIHQKIDVVLDKQNVFGLGSDVIKNKVSDFTVNVSANFYFFNIKLNNVKISY